MTPAYTATLKWGIPTHKASLQDSVKYRTPKPPGHRPNLGRINLHVNLTVRYMGRRFTSPYYVGLHQNGATLEAYRIP